jgi:hypothetical protein
LAERSLGKMDLRFTYFNMQKKYFNLIILFVYFGNDYYKKYEYQIQSFMNYEMKAINNQAQFSISNIHLR